MKDCLGNDVVDFLPKPKEGYWRDLKPEQKEAWFKSNLVRSGKQAVAVYSGTEFIEEFSVPDSARSVNAVMTPFRREVNKVIGWNLVSKEA